MNQAETIAKEVLALEQVALERWGKGDPDAYLDITADDVSYFDPFLNQRLDGIESLRKWYGAYRGRVRISFDEIDEPRVQVMGDTAILTMQFISHSSVGKARWNCTEVYQERAAGWRIVHTHWSPTKLAVRVPGREVG